MLRVIIISSFSIITALSSAVSIVYWQESKSKDETILYERGQKEYFQKQAQDCYTDKLNKSVSISTQKDESIKIQDTLKTSLKLQQ